MRLRRRARAEVGYLRAFLVARYLARIPADPARTLCGGSRAVRDRGSGDGDGDLAAGVVSEHVGDGGGGVVKGVGRIDDHLDGAGFQQAG